MKRAFELPLIGLGTCYYEFSKEDPDAGVRRHRGGLRRLLETELAMARCEFNKLKGYYGYQEIRIIRKVGFALSDRSRGRVRPRPVNIG